MISINFYLKKYWLSLFHIAIAALSLIYNSLIELLHEDIDFLRGCYPGKLGDTYWEVEGNLPFV